MDIIVRPYEDRDIPEMISIWNQVVLDGEAFPQENCLDQAAGKAFFEEQSLTAVAEDKASGRVCGLYILHPNNIGRCGHICNASYAVSGDYRGCHIGEALVKHCLKKGKDLGFRILQFNAVVSSNASARHLYEKLGFVQIGMVPGGFLMKDGHYEDIYLYYHQL